MNGPIEPPGGFSQATRDLLARRRLAACHREAEANNAVRAAHAWTPGERQKWEAGADREGAAAAELEATFPEVKQTELKPPAGNTDCLACQGSGVDSRGRFCYPCELRSAHRAS